MPMKSGYTEDDVQTVAAAPTRVRVREALRSAGGVAGAGRLATHPTAFIEKPFGTAEPVEHSSIRAIAVAPASPPGNVGFLDGIQRYALEGHFGLAPVVRGHAAAVVLTRQDGALRPAAPPREEQFLVAPLGQLTARQRRALEGIGLPLHECRSEARAHPLLDVQRAVEEVERRRNQLERLAAQDFLDLSSDGRLVVDGAVTGLADARAVGVVKSHETQFLEGADLRVALTLPAAHRTSIFARTTPGGSRACSWYLRLWPREEQDLLHGLVRIEQAGPVTGAEADALSGWLLSERTPLSSPDGRWDRLLYPIHMVEHYLRARAGGWT